jgi:ATP-binding cassette subfamily F protein 3
MLLKPVNLLILDEPTNHLDLHSKDILLDALKSFAGTIIFVSHDRAFMEALSTKTLELNPQGLEAGSPAAYRLFYGNYAYYLDRLAREAEAPKAPPVPAAPEVLPKTAAPAAPVSPASGPNPPVILIKAGQERPMTAGERREAEKQKQARIRRLRRQEAEILKTLETLEAEKARLETELAKPEVYANGEKARSIQARLDVLAGEIETKTREWEDTAEKLERRQDNQTGGTNPV